jgi:hypothetical protein
LVLLSGEITLPWWAAEKIVGGWSQVYAASLISLQESFMRFVLPAAIAAAAIAGWCETPPGTKIDLGTQSKNPDFSSADFTKPFKSGTALPSDCSVAEVFFHTGQPAGQNVYVCASANSWTKLAGAPEGLANCRVEIRDGAAQLTAGCSAAVGSQPLRTLQTSAQVRPTAGDGTIWIYFLDDAFTAGFDVTASCSGAIVCQAGAASYPSGSIPFGRVQVTAGAPVSVSDDRGWRGPHLVAGSGISIDENAGTQTISTTSGTAFEPVAGTGINIDALGSAFTFSGNCTVLGCLGTQNTWSGGQSFRGPFDASTSTSFKPRTLTGPLPNSCSPGEVIFKTDSPPGYNIYGCVSTDSWALQNGAAAGSLIAVTGTGGVSASTDAGIASVRADCGYVGCLDAQNTWTGNQTFSGAFDASAASTYKSRTVMGTLPADCSTGEIVFKTDATPGQNVYGCTSPNTWTLQGGSGGSGGSGGTTRTGESYFPALIGSQPTNTFVYNWRIPNTGGAVGWMQSASSANAYAAMRFINAQNNLAFLPFFRLPSNWDSSGTLSVILDHKINQNQGGGITLEFNIACLSEGSPLNSPVYVSSGNVVYAVPSNQVFNLDRFTYALPKTGCAAGNLVSLSITRHGADAADTYTEDLYLVGAAVQWREFLQ